MCEKETGNYKDLITMLKSVAYDPELATDEGIDITDGKGNPILYVARSRSTEEGLLKAESDLGFALPELLRILYLEVGNGGFGPGYGLFSISTLSQNERNNKNAVSQYFDLREVDPLYPDWRWPDKLLPICTWGCGLDSCIDCTRADAPVFRYNPDMDLPDRPGLVAEGRTFEEWLRAWLEEEELFYI